MFKIKTLLYLLNVIFLFNASNINTTTPIHMVTEEIIKDKPQAIIHSKELHLIENPIEIQYKKDKQEEMKKKSLLKENVNSPEWKEFILTFYTSLDFENSSAGAVTCENKPLIPGGVANNVIPLNTKIYLENYGQVVVNDRGSHEHFDTANRLDVFIEREPGESDKQYAHRINSYGVQKVQGYILKQT
ncbi:3D domain-containing protein [Clostridium saccharoperbutylacetonicum]|uniref:3D domain-containing protein n=1 Tax=Clostridium saccharoperbutylacetonicum TaxID=36745 RepID=UPI000983AAF4|nr:3D domain-containing protein [Clostridium saccharoperbutylacetonicum]AQR94347.1 hypothetical protein CLSAP_16540 [Clostridium saccharoperbutylacetonicum]NSB30046.1 3D (Asp-Asp-Asp) domain-containing protein [Clostridium saccharoperbutylacetonicum]